MKPKKIPFDVPIYESSDWHSQPYDLPEYVVEFITAAKAAGAHIVGNGDLFDLLLLGREAWESSYAVRSFKELLDGYPFVYVVGNHSGTKKWIVELFGDCPNIKIVRQYDVWKEGIGRLHFRHGHSWAPDWKVLQYFAWWFVELCVRVSPKWWYRFAKWMGWIPSEVKAKVEQGLVPLGNFDELRMAEWNKASAYAKKRRCRVTVGHTHTTMEQVVEFVGGDKGHFKPFQTLVADGGTLRNWTYIRITDDIELCKLPHGKSGGKSGILELKKKGREHAGEKETLR
jgi:hypothetical protein